MGRIISTDKIEAIKIAHEADPQDRGPLLGMFIVEDMVPVEAVAIMLNVAEPTIYRWIFSQAAPRDKDKIIKLDRLLTILRKAKRCKDLPLEGNMKTRLAAITKLVATHKPTQRDAGE